MIDRAHHACLPSDAVTVRSPHPADLLRLAIDAINCNYAIFNENRDLVDCSASYVELHRPTFDKFPGPLRYDTLMREAIARSMPHLRPDEAESELARRVAAHTSKDPGEFDRLYPDGKWMRATKRVLSGGYVAGIAVDITGLKRREAEIAASAARYRALVDTAQVGIWHVDDTGRTLFTNDRLRLLYGGDEPAGLSGSTLSRQTAAASAGPFGFPPGLEVEALILDGSGAATANVLVCASDWLPLTGEDGRGVVLTLLDITALKAAQAHAEQLAWHDALTGVHNRAMFHSVLDERVARREPLDLLVLDLDGFKAVNDQYGHGAGDSLLREIAHRLRSMVRAGDLTCRLGGDEFAVIVPSLGSSTETIALAGRLIEAMSQPVWANNVQLRVTASIGCASYPLDAVTSEGLQQAADLALYAAKRAGRARALAFDRAMRVKVERKQRLIKALPGVIADGKLRLSWQPQVAMPGHRLRGATALVRWPHSPLDDRELGPGEFYEQVEEAGLLAALDTWVLDAALHQRQAWADRVGAPGIIGVAVTATTLRDQGFPARVAAALLRYGVHPSSLEIEVPEGLAARDLEVIAPILQALRAMHVRLALGDFGSRMSSLTQLVQLPIQLVKLDRSIVAGLPDARELAVVRAVVAVAQSLSIPVLAGGIETDEQASVLHREGVALMQGSLFGRPQTAAELVPTSRARADDAQTRFHQGEG